MARRAGTLIRREELARQALTASLNRPLAEALLSEVNQLLRLLPDVEKAIINESIKVIKEEKEIEKAIEDIFNESMKFFPLALVGKLDKAKNILENVNNIIDIANKIIEEISKEGIHLPKMEKIEIPDTAMKLTSALRDAKLKLETIIEFFKELEKYSITDN